MFLGREKNNFTEQRSCKPFWQCLWQHEYSVSITSIYGNPKTIYLLDSHKICYSLVRNHELLLSRSYFRETAEAGERLCLSTQLYCLSWFPRGTLEIPFPLPSEMLDQLVVEMSFRVDIRKKFLLRKSSDVVAQAAQRGGRVSVPQGVQGMWRRGTEGRGQ